MKDVISKLLVLALCASCGSHEEPDVLWRFEHVIVDDAPPATYRINDVQVGDIDGDGLPDIWTSGRGAGPEAYQQAWYKNPSWTRYPVSPGDYKYGTLGDVDNDGDLDIVVGQSWFENSGNLDRKDWPDYPLGYDFEPDLVLVGDLNADQRLDIVVNNKRELYWLPGPTDPRKSWHSYLIYGESSNRTGGTLADIDGDGDLDILWGRIGLVRSGYLRTPPQLSGLQRNLLLFGIPRPYPPSSTHNADEPPLNRNRFSVSKLRGLLQGRYIRRIRADPAIHSIPQDRAGHLIDISRSCKSGVFRNRSCTLRKADRLPRPSNWRDERGQHVLNRH